MKDESPLLDLLILVLGARRQREVQHRRGAAALVREADALAGRGSELPLDVAARVGAVLAGEPVELRDDVERGRLVLEVLDLVLDLDFLVEEVAADLSALVVPDRPRGRWLDDDDKPR